MKEEILSEFNDKENNILLNDTSENLSENNLIKKESTDDDYLNERTKHESVSSEFVDNYSLTHTSSFSEEEKDKSINISMYNFKDFIIMLSLIMCPSFNFNYLYLPLLLIGCFYNKLILNNTMDRKRKKSTFETIILIYSFLLLVFKIIFIILSKNKKSFIMKNKSVYINLGISYLLHENIFDIIKTLIGESIIIISCICSIIIRKTFPFEDKDLNKINGKNLLYFYKKTIKYIFISFFVIAGFATFNKSFLTLFYIVLFYILLFLFSLVTKKSIYFIFKGLIFCLTFCIIFHLLTINISNIYNIANKYFDPKDKTQNKLLSKWPKFGFYFAYYDEDDYSTCFRDWAGYLLGSFSFVLFSFIFKDISIDNYIKAKNKIEENEEDEFYINEDNYFSKIYSKITSFCSKPYFILHIIRIMSIIWLYYFRNFYSIGVFIWLFFSFLYLDSVSIRFLTIVILFPSIFISLSCMHGSRIYNSFFSDLSEKSKVKYFHFALGNYSCDLIKFYISNIFFFLIIYFIHACRDNKYDISEKDDRNEQIKEEEEIKKPLLKDMEEEQLEISDELKKEQNLKIEQIKNDNENKIEEEEKEDEKENLTLKKKIKSEEIEEDKISISNIFKKYILINIDKITLVIMYFVANKEVNLIHLIFVIVFMIQLLTPQYIKNLCIYIIILFQILYFIEYIMDLLKVYCFEKFKNNISKIQFFLVYKINEDEKKISETSIEIIIYAIIYCFYIHFQLYHNELYKNLTLDKNINIVNYIENKLIHFPILQNILYFIGNAIKEIYIWAIISSFIFFICYFEINFLFAIKLLIFLLSVFNFCIFIQKNKFGEGKIDLKLSKILLIYSGFNTFVVYFYQVLCLETTKIKDKIQSSDNFIVENFPNFGLTSYQDDKLYYNLLPHFFINFLSLLYYWEMKRISDKYDNLNKDNENIKIDDKNIVLSNETKDNKKNKENEEEIFIENNKNENEEEEENEENEGKDPSLDAFEKYHKNKNKMTFLNIKYLFALIIISFTKLYWLFLFITTCLIYTLHDLSAGIFIYIFIFGITFICMFYSIINSVTNFIKNDSYFISKVIRYYLIETKKHIQNNKYFRNISFRFLLGYSLLLLFLYYLYGIFDLFQHGCEEDLFKGCDKSYHPIVEEDDRDSDNHKNTEALFESIAYLLGFYVNIKKKGIMSAAWAHLLFSVLIAFDVYIQKIENYFTNYTVSNRKYYHILLNENTKLKALFSSGEDNFILNLGQYLDKKNLENLNLSNSISNSSFNLSISKMDNIGLYEDLFINIKNIFNNQRLNYNENEETLGKKYIIQFLEAFRKASSKKVSLSEKKNKYKIIRAIKETFEEIIIFFLLCNAITKLNLWSFIYISIAIYLISTNKSMMKYYILFCFIILAIFIQVIIFISNIQEEIDPTPDNYILKVINENLNIPWYKKSKKIGFFLGLGMTKSQVNLIWMDFIEIVIIYIYLDYFSYSIYQNTQNKGSKNKGISKINYYNLHLNKKVHNCVKTLSMKRFLKIHDCMKYNLGIDIGTFDDFRNKILLESVFSKANDMSVIKEENENEKKDKEENINEGKIEEKEKEKNDKIRKNNILLIPGKNNLGSSLKESRVYQKKEKIKLKMKSILGNLNELAYLSFHNIILIIIVIISMMISGLLSLFYITFSLYFLVKSNKMILGEKYYYPTAIKKILRVAIIADITIQIIYQTPYFSINQKSDEEENFLIKILKIIGFNKIINYGTDEKSENYFEIYNDQMVLVIAKAISYFFMGIQILIYSSQDFQEQYLSYIITSGGDLKRKSLMNVYRFNNKRIKTMNKSILLREEMSLSMNSLQEIIDGWKNKLSNLETAVPQQSLFLFEQPSSNKSEDNLNNENNPLENIKEVKEEKIFDKEKVREYIREWILDRLLIRLEIWLYKYCVDYSKINNEEKDEYERDIIQGNPYAKSLLEKMVDINLETLELSDFTENEMKEVKKFFDGTRDEQIKKIEEQKKLEKKKLQMKRKTKFVAKIMEDLDKKEKTLDDLIKGDVKEEEVKDKKEEEVKDKKEKDKNEKEKEKEVDLTQPKFKVLEKFVKRELFQKYLKTTYILKCIISNLMTYSFKKFHFLCYLMMLIDHMAMASLISMVYPLSIFCFAILEYPRPTKNYWNFCIGYSIIILSFKCMLQLELFVKIFENKDELGIDGKPSNLYIDFLGTLDHYKIGLKYTETTFSYEFFKYIIFDALVIIFLLINNYLLINNGLWDKREQEIENIYEANDRVAKTKNLKLENIQEIKKLNNLFLSHRKQEKRLKRTKQINEDINNKEDKDNKDNKVDKGNLKLNFLKKINKANKENSIKETIKNIYNLGQEKSKENDNKIKNYITIKTFNEHKKNYFDRLFPKIRNEKPGGDFYSFYTISMIFVIIFIILFYTTMIQDITFNALSEDTNQFNSSMVIFLLIHIGFLLYDRIIYINQNRNNIKYNYIIYDKSRNEELSESRFNHLKTEISREYYNIKRENFIIPSSYAEKMRKDYEIITIQMEEFNKPLLQKYILHIFIVLFAHAFIFIYFPMKGNYNINRVVYCQKIDDSGLDFCNDFNQNSALISFYIFYITYFLFSGMQIKFGFYDMKRKSMLKSGNSSYSGTINTIFNSIPFLYEIKLSIDWTFTSTCLDLFQWNKFESVYDTVYTTFCAMNVKNSSLVGQRIGKFLKIGMGGTLSFGLIIILIIPIFLFSSLNPTNKLNNLTGAALTAELSFWYDNDLVLNYTLFKNTKPESISDFSKKDKIWSQYGYSKSPNTKNFPKSQIQKVQFSQTSDRNWGLAKPHIEKLIDILNFEYENKTDLKEIQLILDYQFQRLLPPEARVAGERKGVVIYNKKTDGIIKDNSEIGRIKNAISNCYDENVIFKDFYSAPIRLTANPNSKEIEDKKYIKKLDVYLGFTGCKNLSGNQINNETNENYHSYLESYFTFGNANNPEKEGLIFYVFSDKVSSTTSGYSIITFYITFILIVGTYVRNFFAGQPSKIPLTEMPYCKEIINLCEGIKVSRNSFDFEQEEKLYYILMELMRSPDYLKYLTESSVQQFNKRKELTEKEKNSNFK